MPIKSKSAILVSQKEPLVMDEVEFPDQLSYGQVKVKLLYSGICGAQINEIDGVKGADPYLPHLLGHEGSGTVLDVGPGVKTVSKGDTVVLHWKTSSGIQSEPPQYKWDNKVVNAGWVTTFNDYAIVSENRLTVIPSDFDLAQAALFGCGVTTAMGVINNDAKVKIGQSVLVFGLGGVGVNLVQAANMVSANPIIGVDILESKIEMAKKFGLSFGFNSKKESDITQSIQNHVGKRGADVVIDTTGKKEVIELAYQLTHPDGKTILVGVPDKKDPITIYSLPLHFNQVLTGSHGGSSVPDRDIPRYINLIQSNKMTLDGLITHCFSLDQINDAIEVVRSGDCGRVVIKMDAMGSQ